jgi:outer membrane protein assembly factor BamB
MIPGSERYLKYLPATVLAVGVLAIAWWLFYNPTRSFTPSEPGRDNHQVAGTSSEEVIIGEHFELFAQYQSELKETWPNFRGHNSDNIHAPSQPLIDDLSNVSSRILWSVELGEGHAGAAIYDGKVYMLDYDEEARADMLRCFSLVTGKEIWRRWYDVQIRRNHGMSRTVPAVTENFILTIGPRGHVMCLDRENGDFLWGIDIEKEYNSEIPLWYTGQCPIIEDGIAIIATGGDALMIGVDCATGEILWKTPNPNGWNMSHSSVMPFEYIGHKMFVYSAIGGALGIVANGDNAGDVLWETTQWNHPVVAASPVCMPDGKIFLTAGYGAGSMLLQLTEKNGQLDAEVLKTYRPGEGLSSEQQTPILSNGFMFGVMPKDARTLRNQLVCVSASDPTEIIWTSGPTARFGLGPYIMSDDKIFMLDDDATLYIIQKSYTGYRELDKFKLFDGHDAWAPLAIADGYLVLRDAEKMICIDIQKNRQ